MSLPFHQELLATVEDERTVMLEHPFLADTARNRIDRQAFHRWLAQGFLYARDLSFDDNWTSEGFRAYVALLAAALDRLALGIPERVRARVERTFRRVIQYEIRFWGMALGGG